VIDQLYVQYSFQIYMKLLDRFKRVIGAIVLVKTLLHRDRLKHFLGKQEDKLSIDFILLKLSSIISTWTTDGWIQINHLSFTKFVCDSNRGNKFAIDYTTHTQIMMLACLKIMKEHLQFNILCIVLLGEVVRNNMSSSFSYICLFHKTHSNSYWLVVPYQHVQVCLYRKYQARPFTIISRARICYAEQWPSN